MPFSVYTLAVVPKACWTHSTPHLILSPLSNQTDISFHVQRLRTRTEMRVQRCTTKQTSTQARLQSQNVGCQYKAMLK